MWTEQMFVILTCIRIKGDVSCWFKPQHFFSTDLSRAAPPLCSCVGCFICDVCFVTVYISIFFL